MIFKVNELRQNIRHSSDTVRIPSNSLNVKHFSVMYLFQYELIQNWHPSVNVSRQSLCGKLIYYKPGGGSQITRLLFMLTADHLKTIIIHVCLSFAKCTLSDPGVLLSPGFGQIILIRWLILRLQIQMKDSIQAKMTALRESCDMPLL